MNIYLKQIEMSDGKEYSDLLMELSHYKDAYARPVPSDFSEEEFEDFKKNRIRMRNNDNLPDYVVPTSTYWVICDDKVIGYATLKHRIDVNKVGGHFGCCLKKDYQNKGIGNIVAELLSKIAYYDLPCRDRLGLVKVVARHAVVVAEPDLIWAEHVAHV